MAESPEIFQPQPLLLRFPQSHVESLSQFFAGKIDSLDIACKLSEQSKELNSVQVEEDPGSNLEEMFGGCKGEK